MPTLKDRLLTVEDDFQRALSDGRNALFAFNSGWERLLADVDSACESDTLDEETASLAHSTALRISFLAETSILVYSSCDTLTSQLVDEVETLMAELTISNMPVNRSDTPYKSFLQRSQDEPGTHQLPPRKRRRDSYTSVTPAEAHKRRRSSEPHEELISSKSKFTHPRAYNTWTPTPSTASDAHGPTSRKRRLSDADTMVPRQAKRLYAGPRLHAVSDSFSVLHTLDPEVLCTHRLLRSPPVIPSMNPSEVSGARLATAEFSDFDITQAGPESNVSIPARATALNLDALDGYLSSLLGPTEALLTLPPSLDAPCTLFDVPLSPPSNSRSSSVSLDSSSSVASLSPPPSYPATPPPTTCSTSDLPPYQSHVTWDDNAAPTLNLHDLLSIQSGKTIFPTHEPTSFVDASLDHDSVGSDWSSLFQSMNYLSWTPSVPLSYPLTHSNEPFVSDIVTNISPVSIEPERLLIVTQ